MPNPEYDRTILSRRSALRAGGAAAIALASGEFASHFTDPSEVAADTTEQPQALSTEAHEALPPLPRFIAGMNFSLVGNPEDFQDQLNYRLALLKGANVNVVSYVIPYYVKDLDSSEIFRDNGRFIQGLEPWRYAEAPNDDNLRFAIQSARAMGIEVQLKTIIDEPTLKLAYDDPQEKLEAWRGRFLPIDTKRFFDNYARLNMDLGRIAQEEGVALFEVGSELERLEADEYYAEWRTLFSRVRTEYHGPISHSLNWGVVEFDKPFPKMISLVDEPGINAYFPLRDIPANASIDQIAKSFDGWMARVAAQQAAFNVPMHFTELGITSTHDTYAQPWAEGGYYDPESQRRYLEATLSTIERYPRLIRGASIWGIDLRTDPTAPQDRSFSPFGKPGEAAIKKWFSRLTTR